MKPLTVMIFSIMAAGLLWLTGEGFLLLPSAMAPLTAGLSPLVILILGGLFVIFSLAIGYAIFTSSRMRRSPFFVLPALLLLGVLAWLFLRAHLSLEFLLVAGVLFANIGGFSAPIKGSRFQVRKPLIAILLANALCGLLLVLGLLGGPADSYAPLLPFRYLLAAVFILSAILASLPLFRHTLNKDWFWERFLAVPWVLWLLLFIPGIRLPNLFTPAVMVLMLLPAGLIPWHQFILPENDRVGKRLILVECLTLLATLAMLVVLLNFMDRSLGSSAPASARLLIRQVIFVIFTAITGLGLYGTAMMALTIHGLMSPEAGLESDLADTRARGSWSQRIARYLGPFSLSREGLLGRLDAQTGQIDSLARQLTGEKHRTDQLALLTELSQQLEAQLDQPVAAQLTVNTLAGALETSFIGLYLYEPETQGLAVLASAGQARPSSTREALLSRVVRLHRTLVIGSARLESGDTPATADTETSDFTYMAVPLIYTGSVKGVMVIENGSPDAFSSLDVSLAESMAAELVRAWERSSYHSRLMELIQAGISLSTMIEPNALAREIASNARQTLEARFTFASLQFDREQGVTEQAHSGEAPRLLRSLENDPSGNSLLAAAANALQPFRVRDLRKYPSRRQLDLDEGGLRSLLVIPIRLHRLNIGSILAFGKQREVVFTENDESLANLLASQTAAVIESAWLQQELRTTLRTTRLLYELSYQIIQAEELSVAARQIAEMARRLASAAAAGIVLFDPHGRLQTRLEVDESGVHAGPDFPAEMVEKVMSTGRIIYQAIDRATSRVCLPIQTPRQKYGALWLTLPEARSRKTVSPADLQTLANQAALALERALLLVESRQKEQEIKAAFHELELEYDRTLAGLISTLDARDKETEGHSTRVSLLTVQLGKALGLNAEPLKALERGSLLHDIGKIGVSDAILHKTGPLSDPEWALMRRHPSIGAHIIEGIPFLQAALPVIRHHHERWNGSGYPEGLIGEQIPRLARIFSVVDAFDALTSDRPYRKRISTEEALEYLRSQAGVLFDPQIVTEFERLIAGQAEAEYIVPD